MKKDKEKKEKKKDKKSVNTAFRIVPKNSEEAKSRFPWVGYYTEEMPIRLIEHFKEGRSFESFAGRDDVMVGRSTIYDWVDKYEEFRIAKEIGESKALYFYETLLNAISRGKTIKDSKGEVVFDPKKSDPKSVMFVLKTRFHKIYSDRIKVDNENPTTSIVFVEREGRT